jgi:hypothetical protein
MKRGPADKLQKFVAAVPLYRSSGLREGVAIVVRADVTA